jgi:hypothetical protein
VESKETFIYDVFTHKREATFGTSDWHPYVSQLSDGNLLLDFHQQPLENYNIQSRTSQKLNMQKNSHCSALELRNGDFLIQFSGKIFRYSKREGKMEELVDYLFSQPNYFYQLSNGNLVFVIRSSNKWELRDEQYKIIKTFSMIIDGILATQPGNLLVYESGKFSLVDMTTYEITALPLTLDYEVLDAKSFLLPNGQIVVVAKFWIAILENYKVVYHEPIQKAECVRVEEETNIICYVDNDNMFVCKFDPETRKTTQYPIPEYYVLTLILE